MATTDVLRYEDLEAGGERGASPGWRPPSALYLHIPFCPYKCAYCDFVTHVGSPSLVDPYVRALCTEVAGIGESHLHSSLDTVFLGGGTPAMLTGGQVQELLGTVQSRFELAPEAEITIEANPGEVDGARLEAFRRAGVNRISFGAQSFKDTELRALGRGHLSRDVGETVGFARSAGFDNVALDLIYGIPEQTEVSWRDTLRAALDLEPDHVSAYALIVEPGTVFARRRRIGVLPLPPDDTVADMYELACSMFAEAGYRHYEVANWARAGMESRHNLKYWHDEQFFAAGVGAYDYLRPFRSVRIRSTKRYIERMEAGENPVGGRDLVGGEEERFETVVMSLRLLEEGLDRAVYEGRFKESLDARYGETISGLVGLGFLEDDGRFVRLREEKAILANEAWERFLPTAPSSRGRD